MVSGDPAVDLDAATKLALKDGIPTVEDGSTEPILSAEDAHLFSGAMRRLEWKPYEATELVIPGLAEMSADERRARLVKDVLGAADVPPPRVFGDKAAPFNGVRTHLEALFEFIPADFIVDEVCIRVFTPVI